MDKKTAERKARQTLQKIAQAALNSVLQRQEGVLSVAVDTSRLELNLSPNIYRINPDDTVSVWIDADYTIQVGWRAFATAFKLTQINYVVDVVIDKLHQGLK